MASSIKPGNRFLRVVVSDELLERIQEYRFQHRLDSAAAALRCLLLAGLDLAAGKEP